MANPNAQKRRKVIRSEGRSMIASVYHFLKEEHELLKLVMEPNHDVLSAFGNITKRTAEATGVSMKTVQRILKEEKGLPSSSSSFTSPMKKRSKRDNKYNIDILSAGVMRRTIQNFQEEHKEIATLAKLKSELHDRIGFTGCLETLRKLLLKLGYIWRKTENNRKVLAERHAIQLWRLKYLKQMAEYRVESRPIVYTNENYFLSTPDKINSTGTRFILLHAGTKDGFIENASLVYKATSASADNSNMGYDNYVKWLDEQLLPNLPPHSIIVIDNTSYHNKRAEKIPTSVSKKAEMQQWLKGKNITFEPTLAKPELYDIIKNNKNKHIRLKIHDHIRSYGFDVIRLPPYHPELNAIENIWDIIKGYIASSDIEPNMTNAETLIHESISKVCSETWSTTCKHVENIENDYLKHVDLDSQLIIELQDSDENSEEEFANSSDSDDDV